VRQFPGDQSHLLTAVPEPAPTIRFHATVGVGPVLLPDYLDRLQVVTRTPSGELAVSDTQRWAEPLQEGLIRVLDENLSALLGTERIVRFPWPRSLTPEYQVALEVLRFESGPDAMLRLDARWWLRGGDGDVIRSRARAASKSRPVPAPMGGCTPTTKPWRA
jgi:uncharacterized lipoprotein YmbA